MKRLVWFWPVGVIGFIVLLGQLVSPPRAGSNDVRLVFSEYVRNGAQVRCYRAASFDTLSCVVVP